ncbi:MAG: metal transporter [Desulfobacterales bacterium]
MKISDLKAPAANSQSNAVSLQPKYPFDWLQRFGDALLSATEQTKAAQIYTTGVLKYLTEFTAPFWIALSAFSSTEKKKLGQVHPWESMSDYIELIRFNQQVAEKGLASTLESMNLFHARKFSEGFFAWLNTLMGRKSDDLGAFTARQRELIETVVNGYPQAIRDIKPEYGFDFEHGDYLKVAETERFLLYQVFPLAPGVNIRENGKPIIILPPYVLGANILAFLPREGKSYVHCFANQGIPTYIRIIKDIDTTPAVQIMTGEDDARDTRHFCETIMQRHGRKVTLNGFCQGGFIATLDLLSGELDELVDALITCVTPMDGTRSKSLIEYLSHLPSRFRDLGYAVKTLPNGNQVVDGSVMSWVYKLKSMESEAPLFSLYRDLMMFDRPGGKKVTISKTAAAINHWLIYERNDLPVAITQLSFDSYTRPVQKDGTLPVKLFGRPLNFKRLDEKGIRFLMCYAEKDNLVDPESVLAPLDFIDAEVTVFPKGHGAIATSWSLPIDCVTHDGKASPNLLCARPASQSCRISYCGRQKCRGPVRFQLDLEDEL